MFVAWQNTGWIQALQSKSFARSDQKNMGKSAILERQCTVFVRRNVNLGRNSKGSFKRNKTFALKQA